MEDKLNEIIDIFENNEELFGLILEENKFNIINNNDISLINIYNNFIYKNTDKILYYYNIDFIIKIKKNKLNIKIYNSTLDYIFNEEAIYKIFDKNILNILIKLHKNKIYEINDYTLILILNNYLKIKNKYNISINELDIFIDEFNLNVNMNIFYDLANFDNDELFIYIKNKFKIDLLKNEKEILEYVINGNNLESLKYLKHIEERFNLEINKGELLYLCCEFDYIDIFNWLYENIENKDILDYNELLFIIINNGCNLIFEYLINKNINFDIMYDNNYYIKYVIKMINKTFDSYDIETIEYYEKFVELLKLILEIEKNKYKIIWDDEEDKILDFIII